MTSDSDESENLRATSVLVIIAARKLDLLRQLVAATKGRNLPPEDLSAAIARLDPLLFVTKEEMEARRLMRTSELQDLDLVAIGMALAAALD